MIHSIRFIACVLLLTSTIQALGQDHPFEKEILSFEAQDRQTLPATNAVLFTGSSSIRLWANLPGYFPDKVILNRGFGGSQLSDVAESK